MTRKVDGLGRVVLPVELRARLELHEGDLVDIELDAGRLVLSKVEQRCVFCGQPDPLLLTEFRARVVCSQCRAELRATEA